MTTIGNCESPHLTNPLTMLLEIQIILTGVIMIFIVVPLLLAPFLTTLLAPIPPKKTPHMLTGHTVMLRYNGELLTHAVVDSLMISDHDIVIIERDKATALEIATRYRKRAYVIWGNYSDPNTWSAAHIANAHFIVICKDERQPPALCSASVNLQRERSYRSWINSSSRGIFVIPGLISFFLPNTQQERFSHATLFST